MADLLDNPQFELPFNVTGDSVRTVEQDSEADVEQNVVTCLRYIQGERAGLPDYGIPDQALRQNGLVPREVISAVERWEPDATLEIVRGVIADGIDESTVTIRSGTEESKNG